MKSVFLLLIIPFIFSSTFAQHNILGNPEMNNGKSAWILGKYSGGSGIYRIDSSYLLSGQYSLYINNNHVTGKVENLQLFQNIIISSDKIYSVSFKAMVKTNCEIAMAFKNDLESYWTKTVELHPGQTEYGPFLFESPLTDFGSYFSFFLGDIPTEIFLDSILVTEEDRSATQLLAEKKNTSPIEGSIASQSPDFPLSAVKKYHAFPTKDWNKMIDSPHKYFLRKPVSPPNYLSDYFKYDKMELNQATTFRYKDLLSIPTISGLSPDAED